MYKTAKRTETDVQNFPPCAAILASLFALPNDWELAFQIWKLSSLGSASETFTTTEKVFRRLLLDQFYIFEHLKGFIIAVWPKKYAKLSKDSKSMVKSGCAHGSLLK